MQSMRGRSFNQLVNVRLICCNLGCSQQKKTSRIGDVKTRSYVSFRQIIPSSVRSSSHSSKDTPSDRPHSRQENGQFLNPWAPDGKDAKSLGTALQWMATRQQSNIFDLNSAKYIEKAEPDMNKIFSIDRSHSTWMGHATTYHHMDGYFFVTDPVWSERASPSKYFGPKRFIDPPMDVAQLPLDFVLISHTHYDHLDVPTVKKIGNRALWIVPLGVKALLASMGVSNAIELDWWQSHVIYPASSRSVPSGRLGSNKAGSSSVSAVSGGSGTTMESDTAVSHVEVDGRKPIEIVFTPTRHWTSRSMFDRNSCLWGSFAVVSENHKFFFAGDTAYCPVFKEIGKQFGGFDLATIPIGAYKPRWFLSDVHCNPEEAVQIHLDLVAKQSVGIHWGTFPLADEDFVEPALELARAREAKSVEASAFYTMAHGETVFFGDCSEYDFAARHPQLMEPYLEFLAREKEQPER